MLKLKELFFIIFIDKFLFYVLGGFIFEGTSMFVTRKQWRKESGEFLFSSMCRTWLYYFLIAYTCTLVLLSKRKWIKEICHKDRRVWVWWQNQINILYWNRGWNEAHVWLSAIIHFFSVNCINHKENCTRKRGISLYGMENPCSYVLPLVKY